MIPRPLAYHPGRATHPAHPTLTLILDRVRDPGNMGTIMRTALAAGVDQVLLTPGTVDASNPKVVRAAMGAQVHKPPRPEKAGAG